MIIPLNFEIIRADDDRTKRRVWIFELSGYSLQLVRFDKQERATPRHKWQTVARYGVAALHKGYGARLEQPEMPPTESVSEIIGEIAREITLRGYTIKAQRPRQ